MKGQQMQISLKNSSIRRVSFYTASPVECCSRCGQGIKYVAAVEYIDGSRFVFGLDCIEKVLKQDTSVLSLFRKNVRRLAKLTEQHDILSLPADQLPRGAEYYSSGLFMVVDQRGRAILFDSYFFHPVPDLEKNSRASNYRLDGRPTRWTGRAYIPNSPENFRADCIAKIEAGRAKIAAEISRIETFIARLMSRFPELTAQTS